MSTYNHGDIVIIEFPYSDAAGIKLRPVVIVSNDTANDLEKDIVCAKITTNQRGDKYSVTLDVAATLRPLPRNSEIRCNKLQTLESSMIKQKVTSLIPTALEKVITTISTIIEVKV